MMFLRQTHAVGRVDRYPLCAGCSFLRSDRARNELFLEEFAHIYRREGMRNKP